jgi:hypothetical protein
MKSALESESSFLEALKSFRKIRSSKTYNIGGRQKSRIHRNNNAPTPKASTTLTETQNKNKGNDALSLPLPPKELWSGVSHLLEAHFPQSKVREEISAAALNQHYEGLRSLNFEDIDDLSNMFTAEVTSSVSAAAAASTTTT